jgi:hypothetical protein
MLKLFLGERAAVPKAIRITPASPDLVDLSR